VRALLLVTLITLVPPQVDQYPKDIIFVVDTSSSMDGDELADAMEAFMMFAGQSTDEMRIKVIAFQIGWAYWKMEWSPLPDAKVLEEARQWMISTNASRTFGNGTAPFGALSAALSEPGDDMTVVLISDGWFSLSDFQYEFLKARSSRKVLGAVLVGAKPPIQDPMQRMGREGRGGCFRVFSEPRGD